MKHSFIMLVLLIGFVGGGCASYQAKVDEARRLLSVYPESAQEHFKPLANEESRDQLVYLLDYATALQVAGHYEESARAFLKAEELADQLDYHSVTKVATSLVLSEEMVQYKGEDFEKVLINTMNAMNYLALGRLDDALVEARRVNEKLTKLRIDGRPEYVQSPLALYLSAMIWESDKKFDDAYIAYHDAYKAAPEYQPLREDLIRSAIRARRTEDLAKWKKQFPEVQIKPEWKDPKYGEIVAINMSGWSARKKPRPENFRIPYFVSVTRGFPDWGFTASRLLGDSTKKEMYGAHGVPIYSVDAAAIKAFEADYARLVASRVAGVATKAVVADQLRQQDKALGQIAWLIMNLSDRADLRQWSTLPYGFSIARVMVRKGEYRVQLRAGDIENAAGESALSAIEETNKEPQRDGKQESQSLLMADRRVVVAPAKKTFVLWREF